MPGAIGPSVWPGRCCQYVVAPTVLLSSQWRSSASRASASAVSRGMVWWAQTGPCGEPHTCAPWVQIIGLSISSCRQNDCTGSGLRVVDSTT